MYRRIIAILITLLLTVISLSSNAENIHIDQIVNCEDAMLHLSAEVELPLAEKLPLLVVEENHFDVDQILQGFFSDVNEPVTIRANEDGETYITSADGTEFDFSGGVFTYRGVHYLHHYTYPEAYVKTPAEEFSDFRVEDAEAIAEKWISALGFRDLELVFVFPMSVESLKNWKFDGQPEVTEENEGYCFRYDFTYYDVTCIPRMRNSKAHDDFIRGSELEIVITRSGIQYFSTAAGDTTYNVISKKEYDENLATIEEAIAILKERYNQLIISEPIEINRICFYYVLEPVVGNGVQKYEMWPAWLFYNLPYMEEVDVYDDGVDPLCIVNAITREIIE